MAPLDRFLQNLARIVARMLYRSVEVHDPDPSWATRPALLVANHFAGFADPALLLGILGKRPRFLAKATLWRSRLVGRLLDLGGAIPVHRAVDGSTAGNVDAFAACYEALARGEHVAIFPEGTTHDEAAMRRVKTGAARIALGARAVGVDVAVVPVGLHYEAKARIRSRAAVVFGHPIDLEGFDPDPRDREAVHRLTARIDERLRLVASDFPSWEDAARFGFAAAVALETETGDVRYVDEERLAGMLHRAPEPHRRQVLEVAAAARRVPAGRPRRRVPGLGTALLLVPFAVVGAMVNLLPYLVTRAVGLVKAAPVTLATVKVLVGLVAFVATWTVWAFLVAGRYGWRLGLPTLLLAPFYGLVAVWVVDRLAAAVARRSVPRDPAVVGAVTDALVARGRTR